MKTVVEIEYCYRNGDLAGALEVAAEFIRKEQNEKGHFAAINHVIACLDPNVPDTWWVDVIYSRVMD